MVLDMHISIKVINVDDLNDFVWSFLLRTKAEHECEYRYEIMNTLLKLSLWITVPDAL